MSPLGFPLKRQRREYRRRGAINQHESGHAGANGFEASSLGNMAADFREHAEMLRSALQRGTLVRTVRPRR